MNIALNVSAAPAYIDKIQYRPNAPKAIRRRLSAGETDELGKKYQQQSGISQPAHQHPTSTCTNPAEEQTTSFGHIPRMDDDVINMESMNTYNNNESSADEKDANQHTNVKVTEDGEGKFMLKNILK